MKKSFLSLFAISFFFGIISYANVRILSDEAPIRKVVERYITGAKEYNGSLLKEAFHSSAHLKCLVKTEKREFILSYLATEWVGLWANKEHASDEKFWSKIVSIDEINDSVAVAKVEMSFEVPNKSYTFFTDSLTLIKENKEWKILNKVCTSKNSK